MHRRSWPALVAVGAERAPWQLDGLRADARSVLEQVDAAGGPLRSDALVVPGGSGRGAVVRDLQLRLLLAVGELHTESGRHTKVLESWPSWAGAAGISAPVPGPAEARAAFERVVRAWAPTRAARLLPWPVDSVP